MRCESCNRDDYPRISPCIIVVVTHGDKCLLARQAHWPPGRYSAIAGFIEIGETAEQAVCREVYEEVGLEIDSVRYISSQPWPFPSQLMMGFIARAKTTEIEVDGVEISEAHWWHYQQLPEFIPPANVIAGELIRKFVSEVAE
jgi:NAD+ diphosphatase